MNTTSVRGERRRAKRLRNFMAVTPVYFQTHPEGNRATRRYQAKLDRGAVVQSRKDGWARHLINLQKASLAGYNIRMERIIKRKLQTK